LNQNYKNGGEGGFVGGQVENLAYYNNNYNNGIEYNSYNLGNGIQNGQEDYYASNGRPNDRSEGRVYDNNFNNSNTSARNDQNNYDNVKNGSFANKLGPKEHPNDMDNSLNRSYYDHDEVHHQERERDPDQLNLSTSNKFYILNLNRLLFFFQRF
jgi:hypothetical protein